jgi:hypothetical protein
MVESCAAIPYVSTRREETKPDKHLPIYTFPATSFNCSSLAPLSRECEIKERVGIAHADCNQRKISTHLQRDYQANRLTYPFVVGILKNTVPQPRCFHTGACCRLLEASAGKPGRKMLEHWHHVNHRIPGSQKCLDGFRRKLSNFHVRVVLWNDIYSICHGKRNSSDHTEGCNFMSLYFVQAERKYTD